MALLTALTKYGPVRGIPGRDPVSTIFRGIPYAKPPVGPLRFGPAQPADPWTEERICDRFAPAPIQHKPYVDPNVSGETSEDCLYLNIWTPAESPEEKLPVMFWTYGGGFETGTGAAPETDGEAFSRKGVILVTYNYRLGALGYLALPELAAKFGMTGNMGLLDQVAALRWVKENISAFGGDPENITIFGFSAGGMSTRMLMSSPLTRTYFSRVICQSGSGITDSDYYRPLALKIAICQRAMKKLGWTMDDLYNREALDIFDTLQEATKPELEFWEKTVFAPDIDGFSLLETPGVRIWKGLVPDVPVISGSVSGDRGWIRIVEKDVRDPDMIPAFKYSRGVAWAQRNVETGRRPIWTYHMERTQPASHFGTPENPMPHGSELAYVFGRLDLYEGFTDFDYSLSEILTSYWTNFAKTGDPNGPGLPEWPQFTEDRPVSFHVTDQGWASESIMRNDAQRRAIDFVVKHPGVIRSVDGLEQ